MTTREAAGLLDVPVRVLYRWIDRGQIPVYTFGRSLRLLRLEVELFDHLSRGGRPDE